ncbi:MAG: Phosphopantetheine adenylyltransferase [Schlesneria sp.]|nr:Phosphopantetheine adenylyltransferase [Schlesneria sp.]
MTSLSSNHAVYVGSFDPPTLGHLDIIRRAAAIFDQLTVGIGINPDKRPLFSPDERRALMTEVVKPFANVQVEYFHSLTVDFIRQRGARILVRGVRTLSDIEAEFTMTLANRALDPEIDTIFLMASEKYTHISSSLIKQIAQLAQNSAASKLGEFVPPEVVAPLLAKYKQSDPATSG